VAVELGSRVTNIKPGSEGDDAEEQAENIKMQIVRRANSLIDLIVLFRLELL
jgi:hypothetical protein